MKKKSWLAAAILFVLCGVSSPLFAADTTLIAPNSMWKYLDNGSDQGTAWRQPGFDDASWASGPAQLGYGDGDEATLVAYGPDPNNRYITTYFRQQFNLPNRSSITGLTIRMIRDDGAVVYVNGTEVWRPNMPAGEITHRTLAEHTAGDPDEFTWFELHIEPGVLVDGINTVAVEVHQSSPSSSDISFALELIASGTDSIPLLVRGPYLQQGTPTSTVVRWRTNIPVPSRVRYGTDPASLTSIADDLTPKTEHVVTVSGLTPLTRYYYSVGTTDATLAGDASYTFLTAPTTGTATPTRIWVLGDSGTGREPAFLVRDAYYDFAGSKTTTNLWLMLGDNAYDNGTDEDHQRAVFNTYPDMLRSSVLWTTIGNHDTAESEQHSPDYPYFKIFTLPINGEAGGFPSGSENYYSFDYGNIHFVSLDSMTMDRSPAGPMATWLRTDLAQTRQPWIIAFFHHAPYSRGSHNSDRDRMMTQMRQNILPILEQHGVDLVLAGHSHTYERSFLLDSHYGDSYSLTSGMLMNSGNGRENGTGAYTKSIFGAHEGTVYVTMGSSARILNGALNHPAMAVSLNNYGSIVLDINGNRLDYKYLRENGTVVDEFTMIQGASIVVPATASAVNATTATSSEINITWSDVSTNENGFAVERCTGTGCTNFVEVGRTMPNATSFTDRNLSASTLYTYRVRAFNTAGLSGVSNVSTASTGVAPGKRRSAGR